MLATQSLQINVAYPTHPDCVSNPWLIQKTLKRLLKFESELGMMYMSADIETFEVASAKSKRYWFPRFREKTM